MKRRLTCSYRLTLASRHFKLCKRLFADESFNLASLALLPLSSLESRLTELKAHTAATSALLTYLLQAREALQQDSETYNGLIAELVGEAQKIKTGKGRAPGKRGSVM
jgi:hypothetical protein